MEIKSLFQYFKKLCLTYLFVCLIAIDLCQSPFDKMCDFCLWILIKKNVINEKLLMLLN